MYFQGYKADELYQGPLHRSQNLPNGTHTVTLTDDWMYNGTKGNTGGSGKLARTHTRC